MKNVANLIFDSIRSSAYLILSRQALINKIRILSTYVRLTVKLVLLDRLFRLRCENIFGFKVKGFSYSRIQLLFRGIFIRNEYFFKTSKKNPLILDCGANIGFATIFFKWLYPDCEIHAFEPDKATFNLLKENVEQNELDGVHLYNKALYDNKNEKVEFYMDKQDPGALRMSMIFERMPKDKTIADVIALSKFIEDRIKDKEIDFLKMDIEGAEETVMLDLLENDKLKQVKETVIEDHHKIGGEKAKLARFLKLLEDNGFEYQINTNCLPIYSQNKFQNVLIYAYKNKS